MQHEDGINNPAYGISNVVGVLNQNSPVFGTTQLTTLRRDQQTSL
jgi:hypothetical protein